MDRSDKLRCLINDDEAVLITTYPNIFYYSGFASEDAALIITKNASLILTDSRYTIQAKQQSPTYEIRDISKTDEVIKSLGESVLCIEEDFVSVALFLKLHKCGKKIKPFSKSVRHPRRIKDNEEVMKIAAAEKLGDEAFGYILDKIKPGISEKEIALMIEFFMRKNGAEKLSFETICASGIRSAMPHGTASDKIIESGELLTLDFGCLLDGYCSDMTRTVAVKSVSERQREIYDIVKNAQQSALNAIKAGIAASDADKAARDVIIVAGFGENFGHSTGHSVGVEIHELPSLSPKSKDILEVGNVVSVEPGIYIENFGGVRIEDLVKVEENGIRNLTNSSKELIICG